MTATPPTSLARRSWSFSLVVVGGGVIDLRADLLDAAFDFARLAAAFDDGGVVLVDGDFLGAAEKITIDKENTTIIEGAGKA